MESEQGKVISGIGCGLHWMWSFWVVPRSKSPCAAGLVAGGGVGQKPCSVSRIFWSNSAATLSAVRE